MDPNDLVLVIARGRPRTDVTVLRKEGWNGSKASSAYSRATVRIECRLACVRSSFWKRGACHLCGWYSQRGLQPVSKEAKDAILRAAGLETELEQLQVGLGAAP